MKKTLITTAVALSALSFVFAQDAGTTTMPAALPPMVATGDQRVDEQIRALHREMETKIKAIRDEYQKKMRAIVGERKTMLASTTREMRKEAKENMKEERKELRRELASTTREMRKEFRQEVRGTSTRANPQGNAWGFFRKFFGQPKPAATTTSQGVAQ